MPPKVEKFSLSKTNMILRLKSRHWIEDAQGHMIMGEGRLRILEVIKEKRSLAEAAKALGMSYRALWGKLKATETAIGEPLVDSTKAKGTNLTPLAEKLLAKYEEFKRRCQISEELLFQELFGELLDSNQ